MFARVFWILVIFCGTSLAWLILGGVMSERTHSQQADMQGKVADLWGEAQRQQAPALLFQWQTTRTEKERVKDELTGSIVEKERVVTDDHQEAVHLASSDVRVDLRLDQRRKGLLWFPLYDVDFQAAYGYVHRAPQAGWLTVTFPFPSASGEFDNFQLAINGVVDPDLQPENGALTAQVPVQPGEELALNISYRSRGMGEWVYLPSQGVASLSDFTLDMTTDFARIDFPASTRSPTAKERAGAGWKLQWRSERILTGHGIGMVMPQRIQPGQLAQEMAISAPISLGFFFLVLFVIAVLKGIEIHPINYLLLAGSFFSFHLLFAYSADHLPVEGAFALSSVVSVLLVVSYLRLVVSDRFAFGPAAAAQLVYLVGFGLAHFWEGYTGLTVTVLSVLTLFLLMQLTGKVDWSAEFRKARRQGPA